MRRPRVSGCLCLLTLALLAGGSPAFAEDGEKSAPPGVRDGVQVVKAGELGRGPDYLTATVTLTKVYEDKPSQVTHEQVYRHGGRLRVNHLQRDVQTQFGDFVVHDFDTGETFRPLHDDNMAFVYRLSMAEQIGAQVRGYMPIPPEEMVWRMAVREGVTFNGHPCTLALVGYSAVGRVFSMRWVWEAADLDGQPVRVVFPQRDGGILMVEYDEVSDAPFDPKQVELPEGMPVMTGF